MSSERLNDRPTAAVMAAEAPLLLALVLAPHVAGLYGQPLGPLCLACLLWVSLILRQVLPGLPPLGSPRGWPMVITFVAITAASFISSANRGATLTQTLLYASWAAALWLAADATARGGAGRVIGAVLAGAYLAGALGLQE